MVARAADIRLLGTRDKQGSSAYFPSAANNAFTFAI
jgi:hypothetical protein